MSDRRAGWWVRIGCRVMAVVLLFSSVFFRLEAADEPFGLTKVWKLHLEISAEEFAAMQPAAPAFPGFGAPPAPGAPAAPAAPKAKRNSEHNLFGTEFPWASGKITADGQPPLQANIRYSGDITYFVAASGLKRPLMIRFGKTPEERLHGLWSLQLHSMPLDPSKAREVLALAAFREASVPAPRTAFAEVTLTIPGKHDKAYLGLYAAIEGVDGPFLVEHFKSDDGLLMKPFGVRGVDFLGDDWERYAAQYRPQRKATAEEASGWSSSRNWSISPATSNSKSKSIRSWTWALSCGFWRPIRSRRM
jgi:hypothetical protein